MKNYTKDLNYQGMGLREQSEAWEYKRKSLMKGDAPKGRKRWGLIPQEWDHLDLTPSERLVLISLHMRTNHDAAGMWFECGTTELTKATGLGVKGIRSATTGLIDKGFLEKVPGANGKPTIYRIKYMDIDYAVNKGFSEWLSDAEAKRAQVAPRWTQDEIEWGTPLHQQVTHEEAVEEHTEAHQRDLRGGKEVNREMIANLKQKMNAA